MTSNTPLGLPTALQLQGGWPGDAVVHRIFAASVHGVATVQILRIRV
jgi:hypothetical protein